MYCMILNKYFNNTLKLTSTAVQILAQTVHHTIFVVSPCACTVQPSVCSSLSETHLSMHLLSYAPPSLVISAMDGVTASDEGQLSPRLMLHIKTQLAFQSRCGGSGTHTKLAPVKIHAKSNQVMRQSNFKIKQCCKSRKSKKDSSYAFSYFSRIQEEFTAFTKHVTSEQPESWFDNLVCSAVSPFYIIHCFRGYAKEAENTQYPT